jgi:hypothetical protein
MPKFLKLMLRVVEAKTLLAPPALSLYPSEEEREK